MVEKEDMAAPRGGPEASDLARTGALLEEVFGLPRLGRTDFLHWVYQASPEGEVVQVNLDSPEGRRLAHYAIIPQTYHRQGQMRRLALSLNSAVAGPARGQGVFSRLGEETYRKGLARDGLLAVVGVGNFNSTRGLLGRLRFRLVRPLPVRAGVCLPLPSGRVLSRPVGPGWLAGPEADELLARLDYSPDRLWSQLWTPEKVRWRLGWPGGGYWIHQGRTGLMVTRAEPYRGLRVAVVLKIWPHQGCPQVRTGRLLRAACASHRTPFYLYAGFNSRARVGGLPVPRRFLPRPLNLCYRRVDSKAPAQEEFRLSVFEFLDFDAY